MLKIFFAGMNLSKAMLMRIMRSAQRKSRAAAHKGRKKNSSSSKKDKKANKGSSNNNKYANNDIRSKNSKNSNKLKEKITFWDLASSSVELYALDWLICTILPDDDNGDTHALVNDMLAVTTISDFDGKGNITNSRITETKTHMLGKEWYDLDDSDSPVIVIAYGLIRFSPWRKILAAGVSTISSVKNIGILAGIYGTTVKLLPTKVFASWFRAMASATTSLARNKLIKDILRKSDMVFTSIRSESMFMKLVDKMYLYRNTLSVKYSTDPAARVKINLAFATALGTAYALWVTKETSLESGVAMPYKDADKNTSYTNMRKSSNGSVSGGSMTELYNDLYINGLYSADVRSMADTNAIGISEASDNLVLLQMLARRCMDLQFAIAFDDDWPHDTILELIISECDKIIRNIGRDNYINVPLASKMLNMIEHRQKDKYDEHITEMLNILIASWDPEIEHSILCNGISDLAQVIANYPVKHVLTALQITRSDYDKAMKGVDTQDHLRVRTDFFRHLLDSQVRREQTAATAKARSAATVSKNDTDKENVVDNGILNSENIATNDSNIGKDNPDGNSDMSRLAKASGVLNAVKGGADV